MGTKGDEALVRVSPIRPLSGAIHSDTSPGVAVKVFCACLQPKGFE